MATATHQSTWDARIARAHELASSRPAARDLLTFYAALAEYQRVLAAAHSAVPFTVERVVEAIPGFLDWLGRTGKADLAEAIDVDRVASALQGDSHLFEPNAQKVAVPLEQFVIESLLQAFAERRGVDDPPPSPGSIPMRCPRCAGPPVVAVLREESHGAKRSLLCALCLHEWPCLRLVCPACGEQDRDRLPIYTAEQFAHVRIDACDRCHHYIKTIDLTKDGLAVPCVDDIASVALDLWAREQGYTRIKRNVLGI